MNVNIGRAVLGWTVAVMLAGTVRLEIAACEPIPPGPGGGGGGSPTVISWDPNEMRGPAGLGDPDTERFVLPGQWMEYTVFFENMTNATAAAQEVRVEHQMSETLDWTTFELGEVVFNNQAETGLTGVREGEILVLQRNTPYQVKISAVADPLTGSVVWYLRSYDPARGAYGYWPASAADGFLPPNDKDTGCGEGHASFRVKVRENAPARVQISAKANIRFDQNEWMNTDDFDGSWWNIVTENATVAFDGAEGVTNLTLVAGLPYGELPEPVRAGHTFGGWYTGPDGTGTRITAETVVPEGGGTLHAHWVVNAFLAQPGGGDAAPPSVTTAYEGFAYDDEGTVRGTVTLSAKAAVKKVTDRATKIVTYTTNWTFTAKAILQSATVNFSGKAVGAVDGFTAATKKDETLDVWIGADMFCGTLSGGTVGADELSVAGARNAFADKKDAAAQTRLAAVKGPYNVALVERPTLNVQLSTLNEIVPAGYLALTVGNLGAVKIAGKLADGTAVSGSAKLLEWLNEEGWLAVALFKPLYAKKGFIGGLLWLNPKDGLVRVDAAHGWFVDWVCEDEKKGVFEKALDVIGGLYDVGRGTDPSYFGASVPEDLPPAAAGLEGAWAEEAFPWELPVTAWKLPKATAPKKVGTEYDYSGDNPSGATLSYTAKTGLFKGAFKLYWDGTDAKGKAQHKSASVGYAGVVVPTGEGGVIGLGAGTATVNKQKVGISVFLTE